MGISVLKVFGDSQLVIRQMNGIYEVRKPELQAYHELATKGLTFLFYLPLKEWISFSLQQRDWCGIEEVDWQLLFMGTISTVWLWRNKSVNAPDFYLPIEPVQHIIMKVGEVEMVQDLAVG
ncbi:hypothetical protein C5H24_12515, partial [Xylella fastidiosa]